MEKNENNIYVSELGEGISFRSVKETSFKDACIGVHFIYPIDRDDVTLNAILVSLINRSCAMYPQYSDFTRALCKLYGASVQTGINNLGSCQMMTVEIDFMDDRFVPGDECVSGECADLLCELIFRPKIGEDGFLFRQDEVDYSLKNAEERIKSLINDKEGYAASRCVDIMCEGEPMCIEPGGYLDDLPKVTREELTRVWRKILSTARVEIITVGGAGYESVKEIFAREFRAIDRQCVELTGLPPYKEPQEVKDITERMDVQQSRMVMGFRVPVQEPDDMTVVCRLMSSLFGGGSSSLLFKNVREKLSLCYYCSSSYSRLCGTMYVYSGLDESNKDKAVDEIQRQLKIIANNEFTDSEFEAIKLFAVCSLDNSQDSVGSIESWYAFQTFDGCIRTPEQEAERIMAVTRNQVAECASLVRLDTIYLLAPEIPEDASNPEGGKDDE